MNLIKFNYIIYLELKVLLRKKMKLMNLVFGNPTLGLLILAIVSLSIFSISAFMLYSLNKPKFKELMKWLFNIK
ncbi:MAG: hypothetical protein ACLT0B_06680 [Clostridium perfringens]